MTDRTQDSQDKAGEEDKPLDLHDFLPDDGSDLDPDEVYDDFFAWVESRGYTPWQHQQDAVLSLVSDEHVILSTPTGSGKSMVAQALMFLALATGRRGWYTAPIKALVSEKFFDLVDIFGKDNVGMITGDTRINADAPLICCTAEILANAALRGEGRDIGCVAMDEFHFYGDPQRGWAWQVPLLTLPHTQFLLMSATLGDTTDITKLLDRQTTRKTETIADAPRPVPLAYKYVTTTLPETVSSLLEKGDSPVYVVHFAQEAALADAQDLSSYGVASKEQREAIKKELAGFRFTTAFGKTLRRLLVTGVGVHHAGMLPRYRLLVERLAQKGLLPVICGTDTLGVGINVPIHTVVLTALTKFDGNRQRRLRAREFHQIAGRAGRSGFDSQGLVVAEAPDYEIENARAVAKAKGDPKKLKKIHKKSPREGFVGWDEQTFTKLISMAPETLVPHLQITHSMVLDEVWQGGDARMRLSALINDSQQTPKQKEELEDRADEIFATLINTDVVERHEHADGSVSYEPTIDIPDNFALDEPLSPFLLAALELLDTDSPTYDMDLLSMVEATLEDPWPVLKAQQRQARDEALARMKEDGLDYDERMDRLQDVTYPKPLEALLDQAFDEYKHDVPWAADYELSPKSVLRDMVETASDFNGYIARYGIARSEGTLLRYLSDAYRVLSRTVPDDKLDDRLDEIIDWLRLVVRTVDSSLVDEWENAGAEQEGATAAAPQTVERVVEDPKGLTLLIRNALFRRVILISKEDSQALADLDRDWGMNIHAWDDTLDDLYDEHDQILTDQDARSSQFFLLDRSHEEDRHTWHARQILDDADGDHDWAIDADVDLDATQDEGTVVFEHYLVAPISQILEDGGPDMDEAGGDNAPSLDRDSKEED